MPFYLSFERIDLADINPIIADDPACKLLINKDMSGLLTGFIDLIAVYDGRYYVMDYKTNTLPDYNRNTLLQSMYEHNYGLQYWIYTVVLHRYLAQRIPDYQYETHMGGVRYLFVRGMLPEIPGSGVFEVLPAFEKIEALSQLLMPIEEKYDDE